MLQKYPEGMLDRFVTSSSLRLQKTENGLDNQVRAVQGEEEEGNYFVHTDDYLYWMYFSNCDPFYRGIYYTPSTQSSAPTNIGGSSGDGGDGGGDSGDTGGDVDTGGDFGGGGDFGDGGDGGDGGGGG